MPHWWSCSSDHFIWEGLQITRSQFERRIHTVHFFIFSLSIMTSPATECIDDTSQLICYCHVRSMLSLILWSNWILVPWGYYIVTLPQCSRQKFGVIYLKISLKPLVTIFIFSVSSWTGYNKLCDFNIIIFNKTLLWHIYLEPRIEQNLL